MESPVTNGGVTPVTLIPRVMMQGGAKQSAVHTFKEQLLAEGAIGREE